MNTPMANSGISVFVLPPTAMSKAPDIRVRATIPFVKTWRSPRSENRWGR